jgi:AICAR transformylase/IMP cyclohydrolase PurH
MPGVSAFRYGTNPHQTHAGYGAPSGFIEFINGEPSYINMLDILTGWQMTRDLATLTGDVAAVSMKHCTPVGLAGPGEVDSFSAALLGIGQVGPATSAYLRARSSDWGAAYGDIAVVFGEVDEQLATLLSRLVSDGIAASGYSGSALKILSKKRAGNYLIATLDRTYVPPLQENRQVFGVRLFQRRNDHVPEVGEFKLIVGSRQLARLAERDLALAAVAMKYTVSNSIVVASRGRTLSIAAGQQSRILATKLACYKLGQFMRLQHPAIVSFVGSSQGNLTDRVAAAYARAADRSEESVVLPEPISLASDGFFPFTDNVEEAAKHHINVLFEPEGAKRGADIALAAASHGITLVRTRNRYFYH